MSENAKEALKKKKEETSLIKKEPKTMKDYIMDYKDQLGQALPSVMTADRFARIAMTAVAKNPKLAQCTPASFIGALLTAAQLGLEPNTPLGQAYLIPYNNSRKVGNGWEKVLEANFQIGYKGLLDLAHRTNKFKKITAIEVYENDEFDYAYGLDYFLKHKPASGDRGKVTYYYAMYEMFNGGVDFRVMSKDDVEKHMKRFSQAWDRKDSAWTTNFDAMALKTVLIQLLKYAPVSVEFQRQVMADNTIKTTISEDMLNLSDETLPEAEYEVEDDTNEGE